MSIKEAKQTTSKVGKNTEELITAVALSVTTIFTIYQAYMHRNGSNKILWIVLGALGAWNLLQMAIAWFKVLNK